MSRTRRIAVVLIAALLLLTVSPLVMAMTISAASKPHPITAEIEKRQQDAEDKGGGGDGKQEPSTSDTDDQTRPPVFGTYSKLKENPDFNFNENMWEKAKAAVEKYPEKYKNVLEYITDTEFDMNAYDKAVAAVKAGEAESILAFMEAHEDSGKLAFWLWYDPSLLAAIATAIDLIGFDGVEPILVETTDGTPIPQRPDKALLRFLDNQEAWDETYEKVINILLKDEDMKKDFEELTNYTSAMYMIQDGIVKGVPSIIVRKSTNTGGHFVSFTKNGKTLRLRLECGYQPIMVPHWPVPPDPPPVKDSKDPSKDLQNQPGNEHEPYYSPDKVNNEPDTTITSEPEMPTEEYKNPDPPEPVTEKPKTPTEGTTVSDTSVSGSDIIDNTDDTTETVTTDDGKTTETVEVVAGDGQNHGNYTEIVQEEPASVEKPMQDATTTGDLDPSQVE